MPIIPNVKCRRCGEVFSSLRSRCPSCGTRVVHQSARAAGTTPGSVKGTQAYTRAENNTKWQMLFGLILVAAVILAVIVMVSTSLSGVDSGIVKPSATPKLPNATPEVEAPPTPTPSPTPAVESIDILFYTTKYTEENGPTMWVGDDPLDFTASAWPATIENPVYTWKTDKPDCIKLTPSSEDNGKTCTIECIGAINGGALVTVTCFGVSSSMRIYCRQH